jgi:four helix bundle protein
MTRTQDRPYEKREFRPQTEPWTSGRPRPETGQSSTGGSEEKRKYKNYKDYRIWQTGVEIVDAIYSVTDTFPKEEAEGLAAQMRKSAVSIPSDVAEGFVRRKEYVDYLYCALGACARLDTQLFIVGKRKYLAAPKIAALSEMIQGECSMLIGLIRAIQRNQSDQPRFQRQEQPPPF